MSLVQTEVSGKVGRLVLNLPDKLGDRAGRTSHRWEGLTMADINVQVRDGVATVTLDRPPVNAITVAHYQRLAEIFGGLGETLDVNCAILTGAGTRAFCAGLDLHEFRDAKVEDDQGRAEVVRGTFAAIRGCRIPVIAAVNGPARGAGTALATVSDIRIASDNANFGMPEIDVGRCGGGAHLGRLIGQGALRQIFFTGEPVDAAEAYRIGLVDEVVPAAEPPTANRLAATIAAKSPLSLRIGKESLNAAETLEMEEAYAVEQGYSTRLMVYRSKSRRRSSTTARHGSEIITE
jgi:enoyl-CoA hydratase